MSAIIRTPSGRPMISGIPRARTIGDTPAPLYPANKGVVAWSTALSAGVGAGAGWLVSLAIPSWRHGLVYGLGLAGAIGGAVAGVGTMPINDTSGPYTVTPSSGT